MFLEDHSPIDDLIQFLQFRNVTEQTNWVVREIRQNIEQDELRHDDIVVINPDPLSTRSAVGPIRRGLLEIGINSHLAGVDTDPDVFFQPDARSVTFTGIYRAKGNEAGMVYVINGQDCASARGNLARIRNRLFTAMTRSKAWVRVLGVGDGMKRLKEEYKSLENKQFELDFLYPTEEERKNLMIIHRDMTSDEKKRIEAGQRSLARLFADLESGQVHMQDLDQDLLDKLRQYLLRQE